MASKETKFTLVIDEEELIVIHNALYNLEQRKHSDIAQKKVAGELYEEITRLRGLHED